VDGFVLVAPCDAALVRAHVFFARHGLVCFDDTEKKWNVVNGLRSSTGSSTCKRFRLLVIYDLQKCDRSVRALKTVIRATQFFKVKVSGLNWREIRFSSTYVFIFSRIATSIRFNNFPTFSPLNFYFELFCLSLLEIKKFHKTRRWHRMYHSFLKSRKK
jgi:hypothetical protein